MPNNKLLLQYDIEQFLYREAQLLDNRDFEQWLNILADDLHYFMPMRTNRGRREMALEYTSEKEAAYFNDDKPFMTARIRKLRSGFSWSEDPPSRTRHIVSNVLIEEELPNACYRVSSAFILYRNRLERQVDIFAGERRDVLRRIEGNQQFQIVSRKILLDQSTLLSNNLSIFF